MFSLKVYVHKYVYGDGGAFKILIIEILMQYSKVGQKIIL